jgi:S-adenosylmethionine hydrolase
MPRSGVVTLTTDFGRGDVYAGVLHGVILGLYPQLRVVDLTHDVRPQAVLEGAFLLESAYRYFPVGTVHLAVVDPGVGTERAIVAVETPDALFVAPDNGLLTVVWENMPSEERVAARIVELSEPRYWRPEVSATFHGRDVMAPVAAHLASGVDLAEVGRPRWELVLLPGGRPTRHEDGSLQGQVVHVDRFGTCATNIPAALIPLGPVNVEVGGVVLYGLARTYGERAVGELLALIGSDGRLEIAVREGSAAERLGLESGSLVWVRPGRRHPAR